MFELFLIALAIGIIIFVVHAKRAKAQRLREEEERKRRLEELSAYKLLEKDVLQALGLAKWDYVPYFDDTIIVKSRQALDNYDEIKYFREDRSRLDFAEGRIEQKAKAVQILNTFMRNNAFKNDPQYYKIEEKLKKELKNAVAYRVFIQYITSAGNKLDQSTITLTAHNISQFRANPSLLMSKGEYSKYLKEQEKEALSRKHHEYYEKVNSIIDFANISKDTLVVKGSKEVLDKLIAQLFDKTVNSIKKIRFVDSEEWIIIDSFISRIHDEISAIVAQNERILAYYASPNFIRIKETCDELMQSQKEFNDYISEKAQSISSLFGTRIVRSETTNEDEYAYIRPYKKTITPFTAEVSATVFASAENSPIEYLVKNFYPNKHMYPEQIQRLHLLLEELETLREAKQIIENYKVAYQQYLGDVPAFIMEQDEAGFYARLGFAVIDESVLTVEYKFSYTSGGGMAQRSFTVPMTEETIVELIRLLESKLTTAAFAKEQRMLMTRKLRTQIKTRDNFTCCNCGNSTHQEPNLLLEIDHIIPVAKGGCTVEDNLQTLCWKCNRVKSDKIIG